MFEILQCVRRLTQSKQAENGGVILHCVCPLTPSKRAENCDGKSIDYSHRENSGAACKAKCIAEVQFGRNTCEP